LYIPIQVFLFFIANLPNSFARKTKKFHQIRGFVFGFALKPLRIDNTNNYKYIFIVSSPRPDKKVEERAHMARLFPGHARTAAAGSASGGKETNRGGGGRPADAPRTTAAARTAEAVKKSLDFSGGQGGGTAASCDILNKIMAGMSGTILKKE
jgi:hypothetical protein